MIRLKYVNRPSGAKLKEPSGDRQRLADGRIWGDMTSSGEKDKILTVHSIHETPAPALPPELQGQIGKKLREAYTELVTEPVPDRFVMLLQKLKSQETGNNGGAT